MIIFKKLKIRDFKSISDIELDYEQGVWHVIGENNDAPFLSNGSGKSSTMEAIQQCLYNKTTSPSPIDDISRKTPGVISHTRQYLLELTFEKGGDTYKVVNDRKAMKIHVYKNGEDMLFKSIPASLKGIQAIVGMDHQTFVTLSFINHDTIVELLDNFSSSALMKVVLNFTQITDFEKRAKDEIRVSSNSITSITDQIGTIKNSLGILEKYKEIDTTDMNIQRLSLEASLKNTSEMYDTAFEELESRLSDRKAQLSDTQKRITKLEGLIESSTCACCGTRLDHSKEELQEFEASKHELEVRLEVLQARVDETFSVISDTSMVRDTELGRMSKDLSDVSSRLAEANTRNAIFKQQKSEADNLRATLHTLEREHSDHVVRSNILQASIKVLKSGIIHKDLIQSFVSILNIHIVKFMDFVSLDYISIEAVANKASISFSITDTRFNHGVSIHSLSGGEKTRLRLVLLLAMLNTIKELANVSSNLLIFDESLDTLDSSASEDLANLFSYLTNVDRKFIAMISHGAQLKAIEFSGVLTITKTNGVSTLTKEVIT